MPFGDLGLTGYWNADTNEIINSPRAGGKATSLVDGRSPNVQLYYVAVAGLTTLGGISTWEVGDWAVNFGFGWGCFRGRSPDTSVLILVNSGAEGPGITRFTGQSPSSDTLGYTFVVDGGVH